MNFGCIIDDAVKVWPNKEALIYGNNRITYVELESRINRVANGLAKLGVGIGDHVMILVKNDHRFVETMLGALRTGASVTPATTRAHYNTLKHIVVDCEASVLFASGDFPDEAVRLGLEVPALNHVFLMDILKSQTTAYDSWMESQSDKRFSVEKEPKSLAAISYTSGSTGKPKGVLLSHSAMEWSTRNLRRALLFGPNERCLLAVPMFHANGMFAGLFSMLESGGSTVILHDVDPLEMIETIAREKCTYTTGVPAMYKLMLMEEEALRQHDCSSLNFVICGSSEVPHDLLQEFSAKLAPMLEAYGLTECGFVCNTPRWGIVKQGTTGLPYPDVELRIVDPANTDSQVSQGEKGELLVRSPGNLNGYHKLPGVTTERLLPGGWLRTNDVVRQDTQGYIEIIGREDDRIACAGEVFYPKEVENVLMDHQNIVDAAVVPRIDKVKGEVPVAFVVEKMSGKTTPSEIKSYFLENGTAYMHPRSVTIMQNLPLTPAKKVDRVLLRKMANTEEIC